MQDERANEPELAGLEAQLAALVPRTELDRDGLMFAAGARAARRKLIVFNRVLAAACVLLAATVIAPRMLPETSPEVAQDVSAPAKPREAVVVSAAKPAKEESRRRPLMVANVRELAAAIAAGQGDLRPARSVEDVAAEAADAEPGEKTKQPKSSRALLREFLASEERM